MGAAAETGKLEVIQTLLKHGANALVCSAQRPEPLLLAIKNAQYEAATLLLDHRLLIRDEDPSWAEAARNLFSQNQRRLEAAGLPFDHPIGKRLLDMELTR
jgi:ankyrin repeat protein